MGKAQSRVSDNGNVKQDAHGCPACPHNCTGPIMVGSPDVFVNCLPAAREKDPGLHAACCNGNLFVTKGCSGTVFINTLGAHRKDDEQTHCGGTGKSIAGSPDVFTGD